MCLSLANKAQSHIAWIQLRFNPIYFMQNYTFGPSFIIIDLPSVFILIIADKMLNDSLCCSNKHNWCLCRCICKLYYSALNIPDNIVWNMYKFYNNFYFSNNSEIFTWSAVNPRCAFYYIGMYMFSLSHWFKLLLWTGMENRSDFLPYLYQLRICL